MTASTWEEWLRGLTPLGRDGSALVLAAPPDTHAWIVERFGQLLRNVVDAQLPGATVEILPDTAAIREAA